MKKVLIVAEYMLCGGVEKSLISLLRALDRQVYQVTLLLLQKKGELLDQIPDYVRVIEMKIPPSERDDLLMGRTNALRKAVHQKHFGTAFKKAVRGIRISAGARSGEEKRARYYQLAGRQFPMLDEKYDLAIDYMGYGLFNTYYVAEKVNAKVKLSWVHFDPKIGMEDFRAFRPFLDHYHGILCVSEQTKKEVIACFPEYASRCYVFMNLVDGRELRQQAELGLGFIDSFQGIRLLSIGRLDPQKGFDLAIPVLGRLKSEGRQLRWYVIGEGSQRTELEALISQHGLTDTVVLLGRQLNPYSFLAECDLYLQPSRHEGYGIAVAEARAFCKPMVVTDFAGAREQLKPDLTATIVPCDPEALYAAIGELLDREDLQMRYRQTLQKEESDVGKQIESLYEIFRQLSV